MKFVVTGSTGFIGGNLIATLSSRGIRYSALSRQSGCSAPTFPQNVLQVDYSDLGSLQSALSDCDYVVHLAGLAHQFGISGYRAEDQYQFANVDVLTNMALAASKARVKKFIYISSIGVLAQRTFGVPLSDFSTPCPTSSYSSSKLEAEFALQRISEKTSLPFVVLRPPLVYGENCPGNLAKLIKLIRHSPILPLGSVNCKRSFLSVNHLTSMIINSAVSDDVVNDTYVLSDSVDLTMHDVFTSLIKGLGKSTKMLIDVDMRVLSYASRVLGRQDSFRQISSELLVDSSRFRSATKWKPFLDPCAELELAAKSFRI